MTYDKSDGDAAGVMDDIAFESRRRVDARVDCNPWRTAHDRLPWASDHIPVLEKL